MESFFRMRRSSHTCQSNQEPLIVVEESENYEKEDEISHTSSPRNSLDIESPENPYLLSPWRDPRETRKHSLPTPPCTSGITASQVRRLSERGGEGSGPSPREQAFLATLYSAPAPQPGGRRHSIVTISKVPPTIFNRSRRESIAAFPAGLRSAAGSRRESKTGPPLSTDHRASSATEINRCGEKDYTTPKTPQSSSSIKPTFEFPQDQQTTESKLKKNRSNSFDMSLYYNIKQLATCSSTNLDDAGKISIEPGWFTKRHLPMARRKSMKSSGSKVTFAKEAIDKLREKSEAKSGEVKTKTKESKSPLSKLKWDGRSAIVDARMIGHAIESFITGTSSSKKSSTNSKDSSMKSSNKQTSSNWFGKADDDDSNDACDSSLCSTLKDLFVK
ncbi:uncharacterized protein LOC131440719 isoform X2 [Malaya genurostris]|uniref:uncharacterized protein LOC131440719 isoform X2 n=1 Tax=Malaya genurostris TaxID=325434 RepID=UPI0026F3D1B6|nr:uncharacterized protein LOC131440719 isoform X2 [Malaya genurostris]